MKAQIFGLIFLCIGLMIQGPSIAEDHHEQDEKSEHEQKPDKVHQDEHQDKEHEGEHKDKEHQHGDHEEKGSKEEEQDHGEEEEESTGGVGPNNAVTAADEHEGIKLSPKAMEFIGLKTEAYNGQMIPKASLVFYQDKVGIYRLRDGWFKLVPVTFSVSEPSIPQSADLRPGDQIVVQGTGLLRVAELDAFSGEVGHSH